MSSKARGIYVSPSQFVAFSESSKSSLSTEIATRDRSPDFSSLGMYLPNPDPVLKALGRDIKVYKELRTDARVGGCVRRRKAAVKALEWGLDRDKAKSRVARSVEDMLADLDMVRIFTEMLDASLYGYQPMEVIWGKVGSYIVPVDVVGKPADWFLYGTDNRLRFRSRDAMLKGEEVPERKFLVPRQDASYDNPYGFPDLSMCFWPTTFKKGGLKFWVQFTEKYGSPWVIGKHPRGTPDAETDKLLDSLEAMVQDAIAVIPDDSSIDIKEAAGKTGSADIYESLLNFCHAEVAVALLGQNQTTEATANKASAQAGLQVTKDIRDSDAAMVASAVNELIRWTCDLNFGDVSRPVFDMWEQEEVDKVLAERDEKLSKAGATFTPQYFKRAYNLQDGDLAEAPATAQAQTAAAAPVDFAEEDFSAPDQDAIDAAMDALSNDALNSDARAMLAPLLAAVNKGLPPEQLLGQLAELYPRMDTAGLQQRLARVLFVSKLWGRLHGND
ncbi:phage portal protein family protein [Comamonas thiooxydans]|uniref:DUF935 domain-containing protein n=1 Tax=Comamonas thiooxydans TaxID=363952 RepID=A0A0E3BY40_9BURK|nr:DUF935 family protein [Comamonas thiooxydans]KGH08724.1 hypothetical protein P608_17550 [Comamonas thiooxydans]KGH16326.1 hypothetical protein P607_20355 [Comamonas thiooxydans]KGH20480.1 hypothetical protein P606_21060 [Comamonas thiooxydans]